MKKLLVLVIMGIVIAPVFAQQLEAIKFDTFPDFGAIAGFVREDSTGAPIVGAYVVAQGPSYGFDYSDSSGRYVIKKLRPGIYSMTAEASGFEPETKDTVVVIAGRVTRVDFWLERSSGPQFGSISGFVFDDSTGLPIVGAHVIAQGPGWGDAYTDTSGAYKIYNLQQGTYSVTASAQGYGSETIDDVVVIGGQNTPNINFWLTLGGSSDFGSISGFVFDANTMLPISGAFVQAHGPSYGYDYTDSGGTYQVTELEEGMYCVEASASGYQSAVVCSVIVVAGQNTPNINFFLVPTGPQYGSISGFVWDDSTGLPIIGAHVIADGPSSEDAYTDTIGHYFIYPLEQGFYSVTASASGYQSETKDSIFVFEGQTTEVNFWLISSNGPLHVNTLSNEKHGLANFNISPNPFANLSHISMQITKNTKARLEVLDVTGRVVKGLLDSSLEPGSYMLTWDGKDNYGRMVAEGVYILKVETDEANLTTKLIFLK